MCQTLARSWERVLFCDVGSRVGASGRSLEPVSRQCTRSGYHGTPQSPSGSSVSTWSFLYR